MILSVNENKIVKFRLTNFEFYYLNQNRDENELINDSKIKPTPFYNGVK